MAPAGDERQSRPDCVASCPLAMTCPILRKSGAAEGRSAHLLQCAQSDETTKNSPASLLPFRHTHE
jgi:hypothetical protein